MKNKVQLITYANRLGDGTLASMTDILRTDGYATLTCHFCRTARVFDENDLKRLLGEDSADA